MDWKYKQVYEWGADCLKKAGIREAELDARLLLEYVCKTDRNTLLAHSDREVSKEEYESYVNHISQREKHIPLQHITGIQEFMGLEFEVNANVLIPRQDTEILVEEVMRHLHDGMRILDMCTGSGCILLSLLYYSNDCAGLGIDVSKAALDVAMRNAEKLESVKSGINVDFLQSDLFDKLGNIKLSYKDKPVIGENLENIDDFKFEIIVSNPPYIKSSVIKTLMPEVRDYEPISALDGREDGLYFYREIIKEAGKYLAGGGKLFFEIGFDQGADVKNMMEAAGYKQVEIIKDYAGLDRVVYGSLLTERHGE
ncbi:MAG: peptide chain release factor N(5)-glutamine methyltransferase [Lachnospiraceae bacterium]|nr:peptide chain release factor N(5)-glutamine methyltransferase [Lachnospiraceae bacterium]